MIRLKLSSKVYKHLKFSTQSRNLSAQSLPFDYNLETGVYKSKYEVNVPHQNVNDYVWQNLSKNENKTALTCALSGRSYTYGQTFGASKCLSTNLFATLGLKRGDVISIALPNIPEFAFAYFGATQAGIIVSPTNPIYTEDELTKQFSDAKVRAVVTVPLFLDKVKAALARTPAGGGQVILVGGQGDGKETFGLQELVTKAAKGFNPEKPDPDSTILIPYSSGTTGVPKGVVLSHKNVVAAMCITDHPSAVITPIEGTQDSTLAMIPFFHIYGTVTCMGTSMKRGYHIVTLPKFEPESYSGAFEKYKPTIMFLVPPLVLFMARSPTIKSEDMRHMRFVGNGAAPLSHQVLKEFLQKANNPNIVFKNGYGLSESSALIVATDTKTFENQTVGIPSPSTEIKLVDGSGHTVPLGSPGELWARGPQIFSGYLGNLEATRETLTEDGWLRTGDIAQIDQDGLVYIVDRMKELIKVKGMQVAPTELESILIKMEGVADVAVIGVPNEKLGEAPRAFIVKTAGSQINEQAVAKFLEPKVASFKRLSGGIKFVDQIPKSAAGKILRKDLKGL